MFKRSLTIAVIGVLAVGLVAGSLYVVLRPDTEHHEAQAREIVTGRGHESSELLAQRGGAGYGSERGRAMGELLAHPVSPLSLRQRRKRVRQDRGVEGGGSGSQHAWYAREDLEWVTVEGQVIAMDGGDLTILSAEGREIECGTGPEWFWDESGYQVNVGDELRVTGCDHDDEFAVG